MDHDKTIGGEMRRQIRYERAACAFIDSLLQYTSREGLVLFSIRPHGRFPVCGSVTALPSDSCGHADRHSLRGLTTSRTRMTTDYNAIAQQYKKCKEHPWRSRIETYSLMNRIGSLEGKTVLDVACGEGFYTRKLRLSGAEEVVGIDLSEAMIRLARDQESREPLGITYRIEDACAESARQEFDVVVSAWLLVYARNQVELSAMCRGLARRVKSGGRFVTFTGNPNLHTFKDADYRKYGFSIRCTDHAYEGAPIVWTVHLDDSSFEIENYHLPIEMYESAFLEAGFRDFAVHLPEVSPHPQGMDDGPFWSEYLASPPAVLIDCVKC